MVITVKKFIHTDNKSCNEVVHVHGYFFFSYTFVNPHSFNAKVANTSYFPLVVIENKPMDLLVNSLLQNLLFSSFKTGIYMHLTLK